MITIAFISLLLLASCSREEGGNVDPFCLSDLNGNLLVQNRVADTLLLYTSGLDNPELLKKIPSDEDLLASVGPLEKPLTLLLWKMSDVTDLAAPDLDKAFRIWNTVLPDNPSDDEPIVWLIEEANAVSTGTLLLEYDALDAHDKNVIYNVDVVLDFPNASPVISLAPGTRDKVVPIPYGAYTIYFKYWYSNPNDTRQIVQLGEISRDEGGTALRMVLNHNFQSARFDIPIYYESHEGKYGHLHVDNQHQDIVFIQADGQLIEAHNQNSNTSNIASSYVLAQEEATILVDEGEYDLEVYSDEATPQLLHQFTDMTILDRYDLALPLTPDTEMNEVRILNRSSQPITIHDQDGAYLGSYIKPNDERVVLHEQAVSMVALGYTRGGNVHIPLQNGHFIVEGL